MKINLRRIVYILVLGIVIFVGYEERQTLQTAYRHIVVSIGISTPCEQTIYYSIGSFDARFGLTKDQFLASAKKAADLWEAPIKKNLLEYRSGGALKLNLVYDNRQQATNKLQELGIVLNDDRATYDEVKAKYDSLSASYAAKKTAYDTAVEAYNAKKQSYESRVAASNQRGGATKQEFSALESERQQLNNEAASVNQMQSDLNDLVSLVNGTVSVVNQLARNLNLTVVNYNTIGRSTGEEFDAGEFVSDNGGESITVFQFENNDKLVRVLAHEFGHALGLAHIENPKAIMYRLNAGINSQLTADDVAALKNLCHI